MGVTLAEVKRAARAHRAPLAGESAGYLVLAIADQVLQAPRLVRANEVQLTEDGTLRVLAGQASSEEGAELSLRGVLDQLLLVASSGSAALTRASRRTTSVGLAALVRELEAALIPVNRSAARRALSRLHRETARALESGSLPEDEAPKPAAEVVIPAAAAAPVPPSTPEVDQDSETPARAIAAQSVPLPPIAHSNLDGVISALCDELPAPPQFVESDAMTSALAVREVPAPVKVPQPEPQFLLDIDVEFETDAVDSSAAPTVMRAVQVEPAVRATAEMAEMAATSNEPPPFDAPPEARTVPEPVVLRKTLRPLLDLLPKPSIESEPLPQTPTLGSLARQLPVLTPEELAQLGKVEEPREDRTERAPEVLPLAPGVAMVESKQSDVSELLSSFQVAEPEPDHNRGLCRAIKEMAELDLTPAPFTALIR